MNLEAILARLRQYPIAVGAGVAALILAAFAYFRAGTVPELTARESSLSSEAALMDRNVTQSVGLSEHVEKMRTVVATIQERLMESEQKAINYQYLYDLEQASKVRITAMAQNDVVTDARQRGGKPTPSHYIGIPFNMSVQGSFGEVMEFLYRLETGRRFARIDVFSLSLAPGALTPGAAPGTGTDQVALAIQFEVLGKK